MGIGQKVSGSFGAMFFGFIFILGAIAGTWWNEGRTIKTHKGLEQGANSVFSSENINHVSVENEGKLIHVSGLVSSTESLNDTDFGIEVSHLKLKREVKMYQWKEDKDTKKNENSDEDMTTFSYKKTWSSKVLDSQNFNEANTHQNPSSKQYESFSKSVSSAKLGAHELNPQQISLLKKWSDLRISEISAIPNAQIINSEGKPAEIYIGKTSLELPEIGDLKISYEVVNEEDYSIIAMQKGSSFEPFITDRGTEINLLKSGVHTADSMFDERFSENNFLKWMLRGAGFLILFLGIRMLFSLITLFTNQIPILGSIVNLGILLFSGIVAFSLFFITAGIAWVFYRPVLGISLLVLALGTLLFFSKKGKQVKARKSDELFQQG